MTQTVTLDDMAQLQTCLSLAQEVSQHSQASIAFKQLQQQLGTDTPRVAELLEVLWREVLAARRSAEFWQQVSNVEKEISERMAASHLQLQRNYLRLMQEQ
ncbi:hypothetical protein DO97_05070 [Neosynechococcus sphagnicola sy1]|uniref:Uncharacterized protein n=1 Tax=Neosynechococcus sphagnicola sy1 TaxID=1497020 RepID=A0A098TPG2_9CYAN|nr:hypothetical protein [Neosynechococcus sphagnicola]KGF72723.1 hypothetical protein DO97_05070 [Neosynechococcus sphagnicola sy1]